MTKPITDWERADALACWRLGVQLKREEGLRAGIYEPINDDERKIANERITSKLVLRQGIEP